ncbi:hypothetical protein AeMF1_019162 [Aphanomyces euteiches]|nr:hypothetical protein AeMF1_019162 [Aphanomyces euteiches]KAH9189030.1 hypothetical protein AeNC1_008993 [Aphanomyces euteiches]
MEPPRLPTAVEARRLAETLRKRKYRAVQHNELVQLKAQAWRLEGYLARLKREETRQVEHAKDENASLQTQVNQCRDLIKLLLQWVRINEQPQKDLSHRSTWYESTLLAHPITRRQGIQWLSERVYHQARHAVPLSPGTTDIASILPLWQPYRGRVEIVFSFKAHLSDEIDDQGVTIAALETRFRHTLPTDFRSAATKHWERIDAANSTVSTRVFDRACRRPLFVLPHTNHRIGTHILSIDAIFHEDNRVLVVHWYVANDELFPLEDGILRPHGIAWTIYEAMASSMTLVHNFTLQYTPITADGRVIPLERIGQLFGQSPAGIEHRDAYIERIVSAAEASYIDSQRVSVKEMSSRANDA